MEKRIRKEAKIKTTLEYRNIGGLPIYLEYELDADTVFNKAVNEGNWACFNFIERRNDFNYSFKHKLYYGKVIEGEDKIALGYVVAEDELEDIHDIVD